MLYKPLFEEDHIILQLSLDFIPCFSVSIEERTIRFLSGEGFDFWVNVGNITMFEQKFGQVMRQVRSNKFRSKVMIVKIFIFTENSNLDVIWIVY